MIRNLFFPSCLFLAITLVGCLPPTEEKLTEVSILLEDPTYQAIYNFQDKRITDSLIHYFRHKNPGYRYAAAMAFGSVQDSTAIDSLSLLLKDEVQKVRTAAAYALGQIGDTSAAIYLTQAFEAYDTSKTWQQFNGAVLEAIGKCGPPRMLELLSTIRTYTPGDTALLIGQAYGIYRYALRGITTPVGTERMVSLATDTRYPAEVRFIAANYLYRAKGLSLKPYAQQLAQALARDDDPRTRMVLAIALGKTETVIAQDALISHFNIERDYRVKCNIIRAMANYSYPVVKPSVEKALADTNHHLKRVAANFFIQHGIPEDAKEYWAKAKDTMDWEIQLDLYTAANRHLPLYFGLSNSQINQELKQRFETSTNPYERAAAIKALGEFGWNYQYIITKTFPTTEEIIRTACIEALQKIVNIDDFRTFFGGSYRRVRQEISDHLVEAIKSGDPGMTAIAADIFRHPTLFFEGTLDSLTFIQRALEQMELPKEIEAYNELKQTLDFFNEVKTFVPKEPDYNHPIDWEYTAKIRPETKVRLRTNKGDIILRLMLDAAPGTVTNFLKLIDQQFYTEKTFHRVVPNFVIQGGCPRGDGYGSLDYTIRSELPYLHYDQGGLVGMASAGNDTEGTQFFITHSPSLHLDGNYTIFAQVLEGMDIVHAIQTGDRIQSASVLDLE